MRAPFVDETGRKGTMQFEDVRKGDVVRFNSDFTSHPEDGEASLHISGGDLGEITRSIQDGPYYVVKALALVRGARGVLQHEEREVVLDPADVSIMVDARDPRCPTHRYGEQQGTSVPQERRAAFRRMSRALLSDRLSDEQRERLTTHLAALTDPTHQG